MISSWAATIVDSTDEPAVGKGPRVVMVAGNYVLSDARVMKYAITAAQFRLRVTAVGIAPSGRLHDGWMGSVRLIQVPVPRRASVSGAAGRGRRVRAGLAETGKALLPWFASTADYRAALGRWEHDSRELRADRGRDVRDQKRDAFLVAPRRDPHRVRRAMRWRLLRIRRVLLAGRGRPAVWAARIRTRRLGTGVGTRRTLLLRIYRTLGPLARWRRTLPDLVDQDLAIGKVLDGLEPDMIHTHDVFMLGVAARAAQRAALDGRRVKVVYDAHEYLPGLAMVPARRVAALCQLEREFLPDVDHLITVSEPLARWLQRDYGLPRIPDVVLNAPVTVDSSLDVVGVRQVCGLADDVPLLVYGGGVHPARGVQTVVDALEHLDGVHLVVVVKQPSYVTAALVAKAERAGTGDRLHLAAFVSPELVPRYVESADVGVSPLLRSLNHDVAVTNKFCEYLAAGLPIVSSDTPAQAELVNELGLGAVYVAGDPGDCARAVSRVLDDLPQLRQRIREDDKPHRRFSWEAQAERLREIYAGLLGELPAQAWHEGATQVRRLLVRE